MIQHFEFLVEEPSMEAFMQAILPRLLPPACTFAVHPFQGKHDLLKNLANRLRGYARWIPSDWRIVVVVDRDNDDCQQPKQQLEQIAAQVGLRTRSASPTCWQVVNRIAVEELEAWYFGDWEAVCKAYPRVSPDVPAKQKYRDPDAIVGGTWEAFEQILQKHGYFAGGLPKVEVAREVGKHFDPNRCRSRSFTCFRDALLAAVQTIGGCP
jgi:hypothetical protein